MYKKLLLALRGTKSGSSCILHLVVVTLIILMAFEYFH